MVNSNIHIQTDSKEFVVKLIPVTTTLVFVLLSIILGIVSLDLNHYLWLSKQGNPIHLHKGLDVWWCAESKILSHIICVSEVLWYGGHLWCLSLLKDMVSMIWMYEHNNLFQIKSELGVSAILGIDVYISFTSMWHKGYYNIRCIPRGLVVKRLGWMSRGCPFKSWPDVLFAIPGSGNLTAVQQASASDTMPM